MRLITAVIEVPDNRGEDPVGAAQAAFDAADANCCIWPETFGRVLKAQDGDVIEELRVARSVADQDWDYGGTEDDE